MSRAVCRHGVAKQFCGLCGPWNGGKPGQADVERDAGYLMESGDWQQALWVEPLPPTWWEGVDNKS